MSHPSFFRSLTVKVVAIPIAIVVLGIAVPGLLGYKMLQNYAQRETHEKAVTLFQTFTAFQRYTDEELAARLEEKGSVLPPGLDVRSGEAIRRVMSRYEADPKELTYDFHQVLAGTTNGSETYEAKLVTTFEADHNLKKVEDELSSDGKTQLVLAAPIVWSEEHCPVCHGVAPGTLIAGDPNPRLCQHALKQGWKKGQVVGASVLYVPTDFTMGQAMNLFWLVAKIVLLLVGICIGLLIWRTNTLIAKPAGSLLATSQAIRRGEWGARFEVRHPDELQTLALSFQDTTLWLREQIAREEKLRALFQQFIPASVAARALGKDADNILAGTRHPVTVMIINIRNFKLLMEHLPPEQTVTTLNEFFSEVNKVIVRNHGLVSKYLGDTVMCFFGMPVGKDDHPLNAVKAALALPRALQNLYVRLDEQHGWQLGIGVGISTGEPIVGHFGSTEHMEYTALGDVVVEAHRLEDITKSVPEEDSIIISETTYRCIMSEVHVFDLGERPGVKGKPIHAYAVQGLRSEARSVLAA